MSVNCLDIGTIQAFLDGELTPDVSMSVTNHIAGCDACSFMLGEAEEESAFVFPVLEREMNTLVPTQRLWTRINQSIAVERENTPFWKKFLAAVASQLRNPSFAVAAGIIIVLGVFAAVYSVKSDKSNDVSGSIAVNQQPPTTPAFVSPPIADNRPSVETAAVEPVYRSNDQKPMALNVGYIKPNSRPATASKGPYAVNADGYLPGEESYVKTIASLNQSVAEQKDVAMRPSQRLSYERDLAVVDDSIKRMREEVRKDPKNDSAKQVLYSSYQNKIDLLNSVAQKEELLASLK